MVERPVYIRKDRRFEPDTAHLSAAPKPVLFATPAELGAWLEKHHDSADELQVGFYKKATGKQGLSWRKGSNWSSRNVDPVRALEAEGRMRPARRVAFEARQERS